MKNPRNPALGFIFVSILLDLLGAGLIAPVFPRLIESFTGSDISSAALYGGLLTAVYAAMQFVFAPVMGNLSDRFGRRPVLLIVLAGQAIDYVLLAVAPSIGWLFLGRIIAGLTAADIVVAQAYIADVTPPEKRARAFGLIGAAFGVGFVLGPALGGWLGSIDPRLPFYVVAVITGLNWLYGFFFLPESLAPENRRAIDWRRLNPFASFGLLRRHLLVLRLTAALVLFNLAQLGLQTVWVYYTQLRFTWSPLEVGLSLTAVGLAAGVVQGALLGRILKQLGERRAVLVGLALSAVSFTLYGLAAQGWMMIAVIVISSIASIAGPAAQGLISRSYPSQEQGALQGGLASLSTLTGVAGPLLATWLFNTFTSPAAPAYVPGMSFFVGAGLILAAVGVAAVALRTQTKTPEVAEQVTV
jgi:DHA1 family tetracycline resistance protein-like MFS transporter